MQNVVRPGQQHSQNTEAHSRRRLAKSQHVASAKPLAPPADQQYPSLAELDYELAQAGLSDNSPGHFPLVLTLDVHGVPHRWINWQQAVWYYARERVAWEMGETAFTVHGGKSRFTGEVSEISSSSIIAVKGKAMAIRGFNQVQPLSNRELFRRDRQLCAYCGTIFSAQKLTRDHVQPLSRGGRDTWMNVVTACRACNQRKGNHTLDETSLELLYTPYVPNRAEFLILANRRILADQMEFLKQHVSATSRVHLS
jgi:hypothetical protein